MVVLLNILITVYFTYYTFDIKNVRTLLVHGGIMYQVNKRPGPPPPVGVASYLELTYWFDDRYHSPTGCT